MCLSVYIYINIFFLFFLVLRQLIIVAVDFSKFGKNVYLICVSVCLSALIDFFLFKSPDNSLLLPFNFQNKVKLCLKQCLSVFSYTD